MKIKRYLVRDMQEAIKLIKQDLGPEALIVSSYKVLAKGLLGFFLPRQLEVTAVLDVNPELKLNLEVPPAQIAAGADLINKQISKSTVQAGANLNGKQSDHYLDMVNLAYRGPKEDPAVQSLLDSQFGADNGPSKGRLLDEDTGNFLQAGMTASLFDTMVSNNIDAGLPGEFAFSWRKMLLDMDVQENITERLCPIKDKEQHISDSNYQDLYVDLYNKIIHLMEPVYRRGKCARVMTFIGPSGVGKTTTLAKLATKFSMNDYKKVAMVAVSNYRIGAVEQLKVFGDFLGIPVDVVMTPAELVKVLERHNNKDYIFIDTVGRSAHNTGQILELKGFLDAVKEPQDIFLVLSLTTKNRDLNKIAQSFRKTGYNQLIFSKADETATHGAILNLICDLGLPVAYLSYGQGIPDDISEAGPKKIAKLLLRGVDPDGIVATWH